MEQYTSYGYHITTDPSFRDKENAITPDLKNKMEYLHKKALKGKQSDIPVFLELIEKHPRNPQIKNFLSVLYRTIGDIEKSYETNRWILSEHPDYLFGRINLASEYMVTDRIDEVPGILGKNFEIKDLYPDREIFHLAEVTAYFKMAVWYFTAIGDKDNALSRLEIMESIDNEHPDTIAAGEIYSKGMFNAALSKVFEEYENNLEINITPPKNIKPTKKAPEFTHPEIDHLYKAGLDIDIEIINTILQLPRKTLIPDLEKALADSVARYGYFLDLPDNEEENATDEYSFPFHAMMLLGELKSTQSLPIIFEVLAQDNEFLDFWFGDLFSEILWEPIGKLADEAGFEPFTKFMQQPGVYTFSKVTVARAVTQVGLNYPDKKEEVVKWFHKLFTFYASCNGDDNIVDSVLNAMLIFQALELDAKELLPDIKKLVKMDRVDKNIMHDIGDLNEAFKHNEFSNTDNFMAVQERYPLLEKKFGHDWNLFNNDDDITMEDLAAFRSVFDDDEVEEPYIAPPKTNRNDPCPCGSGKKYKKCCMGKT